METFTQTCLKFIRKLNNLIMISGLILCRCKRQNSKKQAIWLMREPRLLSVSIDLRVSNMITKPTYTIRSMKSSQSTYPSVWLWKDETQITTWTWIRDAILTFNLLLLALTSFVLTRNFLALLAQWIKLIRSMGQSKFNSTKNQRNRKYMILSWGSLSSEIITPLRIQPPKGTILIVKLSNNSDFLRE